MIHKLPFKILSFYECLRSSSEHISSVANAEIGGSGVDGGDICGETGHQIKVKTLDLKSDRPELKSSLCFSLSSLIREFSALSIESHCVSFIIYKMLGPEAERPIWRLLKESRQDCTGFVIKELEGSGQI